MLDNKDEENRIIMFSTQEAMDFLAGCKVLFMDGTVQTGPVLFDQVYTIHGKFFLVVHLIKYVFYYTNSENDFEQVLKRNGACRWFTICVMIRKLPRTKPFCNS